MRTRRTAQDEMAALARRRLELLGVELADLRGVQAARDRPVAEAVPRPAADAVPGSVAEAVRGSEVEPEDALEPRPPGRGRAGPGRHARRPVGRLSRAGGWVHDRLPPTLQGRARLTPNHLTVVALLVAAALAVTSWWVLRAEGSTTVVAATPGPGGVSPSGDPAALVTPAETGVAGPAGATAAASMAAVVVVDVAGKVRRPGIATLPVGSRVVDALEAAGGVRRGVDLTTLNLARVLVDGEQVVVGVPPPGGVAAPAASAAGSGSGPVAGAQLVNLNSATQPQLEELPGVGPVTAQAILQWRAENGPFTAVDELLEVSGIGDATLAEIAPFVTL